MVSSIVYLKSLAASGTDSATIVVPAGATDLHVSINAEYAACAGTTGVAATFQVSPDGSSFSSSGKAGITVPGVAGAIESVEVKFGLMDIQMRADSLPIEKYKVNLTNDDATNAAVVAILVDYENN